MAKNVLVKFSIPLVLACLHSVCADPTQDQTMLLNHLHQDRHWQGMWFNGVDSNDLDFGLENVAKLRVVSRYMGCAYGVPLNWFLLLTLETIEECIEMQQNANDHAAADCRAKLTECIENSKFVVMKLMRALECIDAVIRNDNANNRFHQALLPLIDFLSSQIPIEFSGILPGGLEFNQKLNGAADSLADYLLHTCRPNYPPFDKTATRNAYLRDVHPSGMYDYYTNLLNFYPSCINLHLIRLGFHYNIQTDNIVFDPSQSG